MTRSGAALLWLATGLGLVAAALLVRCQPSDPTTDEVIASCRAVDGDTLRCDNGERVRLNGIDAPEMSTPEGLIAKGYMASILYRFGPQVTYYPLKTDRYGRTVAEAFVNDIDLSCYMLANQQAVYVAKWDERGFVGRCAGVPRP